MKKLKPHFLLEDQIISLPLIKERLEIIMECELSEFNIKSILKKISIKPTRIHERVPELDNNFAFTHGYSKPQNFDRFDNLMITYDELIYLEETMEEDLESNTSKEPTVIKGKPETLRNWVSWKIENQGKDKNGNIKLGYQTTLINEANDFGYVDDTSVKKAWAKVVKKMKN